MSRSLKELVACLREFEFSWHRQGARADATAERALNLIFEAGRRRATVPREEHQTLGYLLTVAVVPIKVHIERTACLHRTRLDPSILVKRSALQFLVDEYGSLPVGRDRLLDVFREKNLKESIGILDGIIGEYRDASDSDEGSDAGVRFARVPAAHAWWHPQEEGF